MWVGNATVLPVASGQAVKQADGHVNEQMYYLKQAKPKHRDHIYMYVYK